MRRDSPEAEVWDHVLKRITAGLIGRAATALPSGLSIEIDINDA
jgi:hypothetical protein